MNWCCSLLPGSLGCCGALLRGKLREEEMTYCTSNHYIIDNPIFYYAYTCTSTYLCIHPPTYPRTHAHTHPITHTLFRSLTHTHTHTTLKKPLTLSQYLTASFQSFSFRWAAARLRLAPLLIPLDTTRRASGKLLSYDTHDRACASTLNGHIQFEY